MSIEILKKLIDEGKSQRGIADELNCSQATVKYWLKKYELKTNFYKPTHEYYQNRTEKECTICKTVKPLNEFYGKSESNSKFSYCKVCSNKYHTKRVKNVKLKMIEYGGGKCVDCGLRLEDSHYSVFEFHHLIPDEKDPNFNRIKYQKWEAIEKELDKCVILCANCHRMRHAGINGW